MGSAIVLFVILAIFFVAVIESIVGSQQGLRIESYNAVQSLGGQGQFKGM